MTELDKLENDLKELNDCIISFQDHIAPLLALSTINALNDKISLLEQAKLNASLAYCMNSFYFVYMKLNGIPIENHKINQENDRLKGYFNKIQGILPNDPKKPNISINKEALSRIIRNSSENKEIEKEIKEWSLIENRTNLISKKKLLKGALLPSGKHLTWKDELEKMLK